MTSSGSASRLPLGAGAGVLSPAKAVTGSSTPSKSAGIQGSTERSLPTETRAGDSAKPKEPVQHGQTTSLHQSKSLKLTVDPSSTGIGSGSGSGNSFVAGSSSPSGDRRSRQRNMIDERASSPSEAAMGKDGKTVAAAGSIGSAVCMSDEELVIMLRLPPKSTPALRTKSRYAKKLSLKRPLYIALFALCKFGS